MPLQSSMRISLLSWLNCVTFLAPFGSMLRSWCAGAAEKRNSRNVFGGV